MNIKTKLTGVITALACAANLMAAMPLNVGAQTGTYGVLTYEAADADGNGVNDHIVITDCDENATEVDIPKEIDGLPVEKIGNEAFYSCVHLESIIMPEGVTQICDWAFYRCEKLTDVTIPNSVNYIGIESFSYTGLNKVIIPASVKIIEQSAFGFCENLIKVVIENPECIICEYDTTFTNWVDSNGIYFTGTIYGYEGSTAEAYAEKNNRAFKLISEFSADFDKGDVNYDGVVNLYDAIEIARYIMDARDFTDEEKEIADYNGDGEVNLYDVIEIAKYMMS